MSKELEPVPVRWVSGWSGGPAQAPPHFLPELDLYPNIAALEESAGIAPKTPVLLDLSRRSGLLDAVFSEFLRRSKLSRMKEGSRETYAKVYLPIIRWLAGRAIPKRLHEMDASDLHAWKTWRTDAINNPGAVVGSTWNKELTALEVFFDWALRKGYTTDHPFMDFGPGLRFRSQNSEARRRGARMKGTRRTRVEWIAAETFRLWVDVLRGDLLKATDAGVLVAGGQDVAFRGRNTQRNATFSEFLYGTGCRLGETTSLLVPEIPEVPRTPHGFAEIRIPNSIAKFSKTRVIFLAWATVGVVARYMDQERRRAVEIGQRAGRYSGSGWKRIEEIRRRRGVVEVRFEGSSSWVGHDQLDRVGRTHLLIQGPSGWEPALLWLNEKGMPWGDNDAGSMFKEANGRWARLAKACGYSGDVPAPTAQTFRRSWAMNHLIVHHQVIDKRLGNAPHTYEPSRYEDAYRAVQLQLGHSDLQTTMDYYLLAVKDLRGLNIFRDETLKAVYETLSRDPFRGHGVMASIHVHGDEHD